MTMIHYAKDTPKETFYDYSLPQTHNTHSIKNSEA